MYRAPLVWFTPLPRTRGKKRTANTAITNPISAGTSTTRGAPGCMELPSSQSRAVCDCDPEQHHAEACKDADGDGQHQEELLFANRDQSRSGPASGAASRSTSGAPESPSASAAPHGCCRSAASSACPHAFASQQQQGFVVRAPVFRILFGGHLCLEGKSHRAFDHVVPAAQLPLVHHRRQLFGPSHQSAPALLAPAPRHSCPPKIPAPGWLKVPARTARRIRPAAPWQCGTLPSSVAREALRGVSAQMGRVLPCAPTPPAGLATPRSAGFISSQIARAAA